MSTHGKLWLDDWAQTLLPQSLAQHSTAKALFLSLLSSSSNQTAERYLICRSSDAFAQDIRERGSGEKNNQAKSFRDWTVGREGACMWFKKKTTPLDYSPRNRRRHMRQGFPDSQRAECSEADQGWAGEKESRRPEFRYNLASSAVPGAWSVLVASTTDGSLLRARNTAQWNSFWGESGAEKTSSAVEKTSSATVSAESAPPWAGSAPLERPREEEPRSEAGVAGVAAGGGDFSKLGESVVDCRGVETEAWPPNTTVGSGQDTVEADPSLLASCPCTVNPCVCVCGEITSLFAQSGVYCFI